MHNVSEFIAECLDSVLLQKVSEIEIICVDDASEDNTLSIVESYSLKNPNLIQIIRIPENSGAPNARNVGLKIATGEYIQFLDADDYLLEGKLKHQLNIISELKEKPDFIAGAYIRRAVVGTERVINVKIENKWLSLFKADLGCTCSNLWKRNAVEMTGGFNVNLKSSQEYGLMFELLKKNGLVISDSKPLTMIRDRPPGKSISRKNPPKNWEQYILLRGETLDYIKTNLKLTSEELLQFHQLIFESIRILYNFSPNKSVELYKKFIPSEFHPIASAVVSKSYCRMYAVFGFQLAERIRSFVRIFKGKIVE